MGGAYRMVRHLLSIHTSDQLYLHSLQADLNHFSSIACLWWGMDDISFSWKSNENFGCYGIDLLWENACNHHKSFSYDRMFLKLADLKLADKVDMDKISNKFENWPDQIINLRVTSP